MWFAGHDQTLRPNFPGNAGSTKSEYRDSKRDKRSRGERRDLGESMSKQAVGRFDHWDLESVSDFELAISDLLASQDSLFSCFTTIQPAALAVK